MTPEPARSSRRDVLKGALAASLTASAAVESADAEAAEVAAVAANETQPNPVALENSRPGNRDWQLTRIRIEPSKGYRSPAIEGYCDRQSVAVGEKIAFKVSTNPAVDFQIEIFRMGWYSGVGARKLTTLGPLRGATQPVPEVGAGRLRECRWATSAELTIPAEWTSGVYLGRLTTLTEKEGSGYWQSYVIFVVRDDRPADIVFQVSDNTWQAYNRWPDDYSLYTDPRAAHAPGVAVSFDRPYAKYPQIFDVPQSVGSGEFLLWEYPLLFWLEKHGYDVTYCSNVDVIDPAVPRRGRVFLSVGHDEYWDLRQYDSLKSAVDAGVSLLFLSANTAYMVSPFSPSGDGRANRIITRTTSFGPLSKLEAETYPHVLSGPYAEPGPDEGLLIGARSVVPFNGAGDFVCTKPEHWLYEGTGMKRGDRIPGLIGWEYHGDPADLPGLEVVAEGTVLSGGTKPGHWTTTVYPGPKGSFVFNASTIWWAQGLSNPPGHILPWSHWSRPHGPDERVERMTHNLLRRALRGGKAPAKARD